MELIAHRTGRVNDVPADLFALIKNTREKKCWA